MLDTHGSRTGRRPRCGPLVADRRAWPLTPRRPSGCVLRLGSARWNGADAASAAGSDIIDNVSGLEDAFIPLLRR
jgi:hypothetical protein